MGERAAQVKPLPGAAGRRSPTMSPPPELPPSLDDIAEIAGRVQATLPEPIRSHLAAVHVRVEDLCDEETEAAMGLEGPFDLLGLYRGVALNRKSLLDVAHDIDMIVLYRRAILDYWCETGEPLSRIVRHVLIHEVGHHLGFSDDDMERIEREVER
jgi:predicted Zn-dependent protease with MMP-like domain